MNYNENLFGIKIYSTLRVQLSFEVCSEVNDKENAVSYWNNLLLNHRTNVTFVKAKFCVSFCFHALWLTFFMTDIFFNIEINL